MRRNCGVTALLLLLPLAAQAQVTESMLLRAQKETANWLMYGHDYSARRYSLLDQVNLETVDRLAPAWVFQFPQEAARSKLECSPLVVNGVILFQRGVEPSLCGGCPYGAPNLGPARTHASCGARMLRTHEPGCGGVPGQGVLDHL